MKPNVWRTRWGFELLLYTGILSFFVVYRLFGNYYFSVSAVVVWAVGYLIFINRKIKWNFSPVAITTPKWNLQKSLIKQIRIKDDAYSRAFSENYSLHFDLLDESYFKISGLTHAQLSDAIKLLENLEYGPIVGREIIKRGGFIDFFYKTFITVISVVLLGYFLLKILYGFWR